MKGFNGSFSLWSLAADDRNDDRRKECKDGDDNDADRSASLKITYLARGEKAFVNRERAAVAARVEAMILHKASGLVAGLFGKNVMKIDLCAADVSEREMVGGCSASVLEFWATVVPFSTKVLEAWAKDTKVGCGAVGLVQQISQETQCLSLAGHAAREKNPSVEISRVDVISMAKVESSALLVAAPTVAASAMVAVAPAADTAKAVAVVRTVPPPPSGLYESCQKVGEGGGGGGGGEIPAPVKL